MNDVKLISLTADFVKGKFDDESTGHDWWHMYRVWKLAKRINETEKADQTIVELAALLHDIADWKFHEGDMEAGPKAARKWLKSLKVSEQRILHIENIIRNVYFKGAAVPPNMSTLEGKIIHDADKLDAMGAIGIARLFSYAAASGRKMHDPNTKPILNKDLETYKSDKNTAINHFYEKLLLLKDRMYTDTAKQIAGTRHDLMEDYLKNFYAEWEGET